MAQPEKTAPMSKNDQSLLAPGDLLLAVGLLTRLPVPISDTSRSARAAWAYPLAGLVPAGLACLASLIALWMGLPAELTAIVALATLVITTGAMHEDGLSDTADGLWGGWHRENRLDIMKDSHIGAYGVVALILGLGARWGALTYLFEADTAYAAIFAAAVMSRATMPALMATLPHARDTGLSHSVGNVTPVTALTAAGIAAVLALLFTGWASIGAGIAAILVTAAFGRIARIKIGGQTGDILGANQQLAEIAVLFALIA